MRHPQSPGTWSTTDDAHDSTPRRPRGFLRRRLYTDSLSPLRLCIGKTTPLLKGLPHWCGPFSRLDAGAHANDGRTMTLDTDWVRAQFPAFTQPSLQGQAFFENAGGSYTCKPVIDRLMR